MVGGCKPPTTSIISAITLMKDTPMPTYNLPLTTYRSLFTAYGPQHWWPADTRDEMIIGAILTQNTQWSNVEKAIARLKELDLCTLEAIASTPDDYLAKNITPVGYFNVKATRLINVAKSIDIHLLESEPLAPARLHLLNITGIGPETADSILLYGFNKPIFVIDAYTKRLFTRLGVGLKDDKYATFQQYFMQNLPSDVQLYNEFHALIVVHCKDVCKARPVCERCILHSTFCIN